MIQKYRNRGTMIAYQLRPRKAIERNLFLSILKRLDRHSKIDLENYRYVGFGAAFLEDFKALHAEFGIIKMDCIEADSFAQSRQNFNNPYEFIKLFSKTSTQYITEGDFKQDCRQIIWWDYVEPKSLRQQLKDIELTGQKISNLDILKFTFNAELESFANTHKKNTIYKLINFRIVDSKEVLRFLQNDATYKIYLPETITEKNIEENFSAALRALKRGLKEASPNLEFRHLAAFTYADGATMTTLTGIVCKKESFKNILEDSGLNKWEFYEGDTINELIPSAYIEVPVMTIPERVEIDKRIHFEDPETIAKRLPFLYGNSLEEHIEYILGYCKYYRYLPYYSKVIY
jgi:hypothetical protein